MVKANASCLDTCLVKLQGHDFHIHMGFCCMRVVKNRYSVYVISVKDKYQIISHGAMAYYEYTIFNIENCSKTEIKQIP